MTSIQADTTVEAPPEAVFGLLNTPTESVRSGQSQTFSDVTPLENGGHEYDYEFRMVGVELTGRVRTTVHDPPNRLALSYTGDITATIEFTLAATGETETRFEAEGEYELPGRVLEAVARPVVRTYNQWELDGFVENTRDRVEARFDPDDDEYGAYGLGDAHWSPEPLPEET